MPWLPIRPLRVSERAMRMTLAAAAMASALAPVPAFASAPIQAAEAAVSPPSAEVIHATRGVVKAISATTLVVSRPKNRGDIALRLSPALRQEGTLVVGATVTVRYRDEGRDHVATAIAVQAQHQ